MNFRFVYQATILVIALILGGCGNKLTSSRPISSSPDVDSLHAHEHARDAVLYSSPADEEVDTNILVRRYDLKGHFDWATHRLHMTSEIAFKVAAPTKKEVLLNSSSLTIRSVTLTNGISLPYAVDAGKNLLKIDLSSLDPAALANEQKLMISYETTPRDRRGLRALGVRKGDPVQVGGIGTFSEPRGASFWMPCNDKPSNRAEISVEFTMPESETLISNGDLVLNEVINGSRRMKYSTRYSIPTYLMAFAVGEFQTATRYHNSLPVSIMARKGAPIDWDGMLSIVIRQIRTFEKLLVPYPFEKYVVVLLPEFGGGIEHAGITFQSEEYGGQGSHLGAHRLTAHELGHQWFGDMITVKNWDDIWIKEGMATLLAEEASRPFADQQNLGNLFGSRFAVTNGDAVINPALLPEEKYNTGPYGRSAWVLTQIRSLVGEQVFWGTLAKVLRDHAYGNISTDEFLKAWEPSLGTTGVQKLKTALFAKTLPELTWTKTESSVSLQLTDTENTLLAPFEIRTYGPGTEFVSTTLTSGKTETITETGKRFIQIDPRELHPYVSFIRKAETLKEITSYLVPKTDEDISSFLTHGSYSQEVALNTGEGWKFEPPQFARLWEGLGSEKAKMLALQKACEIAKATPSQVEAWKQTLRKPLLRPHYLGLDSLTNLIHCQPLISPEYFSTRWSQLETTPKEIPMMELFYLGAFAPEPSVAFSAWGKLGQEGSSVQSRMFGLGQLTKHLVGASNYPKPSDIELPKWKKYFREIFAQSEVFQIQLTVITAAAITKDVEILPHLATVIKKTPLYQKAGVCSGYLIAKDNPEAWKAFVNELGDLTQYPSEAQAVIKAPESCPK